MHIEIDDWLTAIVFLGGLAGVLFLLMYWASRLAATHAPNLAKFSCLPEPDGEATRFTLVNTGTGTAFDLAVRSVRDPRGEPFARTPLLGPATTMTWTLSPAAPGPTSGDAPAPDQTVEWLSVEWRLDPTGPRRWTTIPVRIPMGLIGR